MLTKLKIFILVQICFFLTVPTMPSTAAPDLLWPLQDGYTFKYQNTNGGEPWDYKIVWEKVEFDSNDYFRIIEHNLSDPEDPEGWNEEGFLRSTEDAVYIHNLEGADFILFQTGNVEDFWLMRDRGEGEVYRYIINTIVAVNDSVTVPYGSFTGAYQYCIDACKDLEKTECSDQCIYYWVVPNTGLVKRQDQNGSLELDAIIPPDIGWFHTSHRRYEDGGALNRLSFGFQGGIDPGNPDVEDPPQGYLWIYNPVPIEELTVDPETSFTLYDSADNEVPVIRQGSFYSLKTAYYDSPSDLNGDHEFLRDEEEFLHGTVHEVRGMVPPARPGSKVILPPLAIMAIARRSEPRPLSLVLTTVTTSGCTTRV